MSLLFHEYVVFDVQIRLNIELTLTFLVCQLLNRMHFFI